MNSENLRHDVAAFADPILKPLLLEVVAAFVTRLFDADRARIALVSLFEGLCEPHLRTERNCQFVERCLSEVAVLNESASVPSRYRAFLSDANALHDVISSPAIAENFGCTPEQLLLEARSL
jgi:hypothetical protein